MKKFGLFPIPTLILIFIVMLINPAPGWSDPLIVVFPMAYDFGDVGQNQMVTMNLSIWNSGTGTMYYWIDDFDTFCIVEPWSGSSQDEVNIHTVMCFTSPLDPGPHQCDLTIYSSGGNGVFTVYVNVVP